MMRLSLYAVLWVLVWSLLFVAVKTTMDDRHTYLAPIQQQEETR